MNIQALKAQEAVVTTASVEIKTLAIGRRQVTLAVFRQIVDEPLIDGPQPRLLGDPWGVVNYHPDKCSEDGAHTHVVWQKGDELRRASISHAVPSWAGSDEIRLYDLARLAVYRDIDETGVLQVKGPRYDGEAQLISTRGNCLIWNAPELQAAKTLAQLKEGTGPTGSIFFAGRSYPDPASAREAVLKFVFATVRLPDAYNELTSEQCWSVYGRLQADMMQRLAEHQRIVAELCALPQLFIAV